MYNLCKLYVIDKLLRNRRQYPDTKFNLNYFVKLTDIFSADMFILLLVSGFISSESDENGKAAIPHWENLECQVVKLSMYCTELDFNYVKPCIVL